MAGGPLAEQDLDLVTTFREVVLAGWASAVRPAPHGMRSSYHVGAIEESRELVPSKSLDTRPDGSPWLGSMDRILTPLSLEDLGHFSLGPAVDDVKAVIEDTVCQAMPYCICPATRTISIVQHEPGFSPTEASFMFVGQRQNVKRIVAVPWKRAVALAESLPEAKDMGPVLLIQMTGRCGSTVLTKALEWLDVGCQSVSEPALFEHVHDMLERGLCSREEAVRVLRASVLMLVHQRRLAHPEKRVVVIKNRTLAPTWRSCELMPEALPEVQQLFQWRTVEDVIGSFNAATEANMVSDSAKYLARHGMDGTFWPLNGSPAPRWMERAERALREDPLLALPGLELPEKSAQHFAGHGALGFLTFMSVVDSHVAIALGRRGLFAHTLKYEDLMERKSVAVRELLERLGWLHLVPNASALGTPEADRVFLRDAHAGGGLAKGNGTTLGGDLKHLEKAKLAAASGQGARENAHLQQHRAEIVRELMRHHALLQHRGYDLDTSQTDRRSDDRRSTMWVPGQTTDDRRPVDRRSTMWMPEKPEHEDVESRPGQSALGGA
jgi:hypothetical protein